MKTKKLYEVSKALEKMGPIPLSICLAAALKRVLGGGTKIGIAKTK